MNMVQGSVQAHQGCVLGTGWGADTTAARWRGDWGAPVSTTALAPQSHPFPPNKGKGMGCSRGEVARREREGRRRAVTLATGA